VVRPEELARIALFEGLEPRTLALVAGIATPRRYRRGAAIFAEGEPGAGFHVVVEGRVKVFKLSPDGKEQILHVWGPGEPFGEVAALEGRPFPAHAEALEDCRTAYLPRAGLLELIRRSPEFALELLGELAGRLRRFAQMVESLALREVPGRLAAYLLLLDDRQGGAGRVELDLAKGQLANLLGTMPETLSRILARLAREGLLESAGPRGYVLTDRAALEELAAGTRRLG
jgi:CRP/FNR family transcriptional regulator, dissimilatory nitrate respiration regulator